MLSCGTDYPNLSASGKCRSSDFRAFVSKTEKQEDSLFMQLYQLTGARFRDETRASEKIGRGVQG